MKSLKKTIAVLVAISMLFGCVVGGTIAWLMDNTTTVTNTFTNSDVDIELSEGVDTDKDGAHSFKMIPGHTITKDPLVTVKADSEVCLAFVKVEELNGFSSYMTYEMADGWIALDATNNPGVYYREVAYTNADQSFPVLKNNTVTVKNTVTKSDMDTVEAATNKPQLKVTAYAMQLMKDNTTPFTPAQAWDELT